MSQIRKIILVAGARPNFMKVAPIWHELRKYPEYFRPLLIHTGQHYYYIMSKAFFEDLGITRPDIHLGVGSGTHATQTAKIMLKFEKVCLKEKPDLVMVVGDVNSTLACSVVAAKLLTPLAHVEAGLRSFDRSMPEEVNRIVTDSLSDFLFTTCEDANENLRREGVSEEKIFFVGNVMIDSLLKFRVKAETKGSIKMEEKSYAVLTLHRPSNVDSKEVFRNILEALTEVSNRIPILFPAHPRTQERITSFGYESFFSRFTKPNSNKSISLRNSIFILDPLPYLQFLNLMSNAKFVLTDSGGIQEETTILGIPCLTLRKNTERPITVTEGTNKVVGTDKEQIITESLNILSGGGKIGRIPKLWDGKAAERIVEILKENL